VLKSTVSDSPYSGTLPMNNLDQALDLIQTSYHLKASKDGKKIILTAE